jgi:hypothetical protein
VLSPPSACADAGRGLSSAAALPSIAGWYYARN